MRSEIFKCPSKGNLEMLKWKGKERRGGQRVRLGRYNQDFELNPKKGF